MTQAVDGEARRSCRPARPSGSPASTRRQEPAPETGRRQRARTTTAPAANSRPAGRLRHSRKAGRDQQRQALRQQAPRHRRPRLDAPEIDVVPERRADREQHQRRGRQRSRQGSRRQAASRRAAAARLSRVRRASRCRGRSQDRLSRSAFSRRRQLRPTASVADCAAERDQPGALAGPIAQSTVRRRTAKRPSPLAGRGVERQFGDRRHGCRADRRRPRPAAMPRRWTTAPMPTSAPSPSGSARPESRQRQARSTASGRHRSRWRSRRIRRRPRLCRACHERRSHRRRSAATSR